MRFTSSILKVRQVLRPLALQGGVPEYRAEQAVRDLLDLRIARYAHSVLLPRIWQLRHNVTDAIGVLSSGGTKSYRGIALRPA